MNKQDLAILIQVMDAQRKAGGFTFEIMPQAALTMQRLSELFNAMKPESRLVIEALQEAQAIEGQESTDIVFKEFPKPAK